MRLLNVIWYLLIAGGVFVASSRGQVDVVTKAALSSANQAVETALSLVGVMCLWLGLLKIAERAGLVASLAKILRPLARKVFPSIPKNHPALGNIVMNIAANLVGMGSAATPLGLLAMKELQQLNDTPDTASDAMCTLVLLNTSGLTLIPASVIALRAGLGSSDPTATVGVTLVASAAATFCVVVLDALFRRRC